MNIASIALTGFFVWSSLSPALTPASASSTEPAVPLVAAPEKTVTVAITGYNAVPEQTDSDPYTTAWGIYSNPEIVVAVSRDLRGVLPFGTVVVFESDNPTGTYCGYEKVEHLIGYRVVADTMNARHSDRMDILFPVDANIEIGVDGKRKAVNAAKVLASCGNITARVVGRIDIKDVPESQSELALRVERTLASK